MQQANFKPISPDKPIKVFIDFDGTITKLDVGEHIFRHFAPPELVMEIIAAYRVGKMNAKTVWDKLFAVLPELDKTVFDDYIETFEIDPSFKEFVEFAKNNNLSLMIVSDGWDYYIERLLQREGLAHIPHFSNSLLISESGKCSISFPYTDEECTLCGFCKRNKVLENSGDEEISCYIGNGTSDTCAAQFTDVVFAKDDLLKFCEKENISYYPFESFAAVQKRFEEIIKKQKVRRRNRSKLNRKSVYLLG